MILKKITGLIIKFKPIISTLKLKFNYRDYLLGLKNKIPRKANA